VSKFPLPSRASNPRDPWLLPPGADGTLAGGDQAVEEQ
jgi:hypothetical protein